MIALLVVAAVLGTWELIVAFGVVDSLILPPPSEIAQALYVDRDLLLRDLGVTSYEVVLGLLGAIGLGLVLAALMHFSPLVRRGLHPLIVGSQAVPILVIAPLLILILGFGLGGKLVIVVPSLSDHDQRL